MPRNSERQPRHTGRRRGAVLLLVLVMVGVLFIIGLGAVSSATRDTQSGKNFAAYAVALQAAQSGLEVAKRRLDHPWDVGLDHGQDWGGTGGYVSMPAPTDGNGVRMDAYYSIVVTTASNLHTVTVTGKAVVPGGSVNDDDDLMATRTVQAVIERPKIFIPYALLAEGNVTLPANVTVTGDLHSNGNVTVSAGATVQGNITAVGTITVTGTCTGTRTPGAKAVFVPPMVYYGYRPNYDYNGLTNNAVELAGVFIAVNPPSGLPNNPDNVFYSDQAAFGILTGVIMNNYTMVCMYDLVISGNVTIKAFHDFPAALINDDLIILNNAYLKTEGMVKLRDDVKGSSGDGQAPAARWEHKGPLVMESGASISANFLGAITIDYRADRRSYQPVGGIVLPLVMLSYTENP